MNTIKKDAINSIFFYWSIFRGVIKMKSQEVNVYREVQRNTENAMKVIDTITEKIHDEQLSMQMSRQSLKYSELHNLAMENLLQAKAEPYHGNYISDAV